MKEDLEAAFAISVAILIPIFAILIGLALGAATV